MRSNNKENNKPFISNLKAVLTQILKRGSEVHLPFHHKIKRNCRHRTFCALHCAHDQFTRFFSIENGKMENLKLPKCQNVKMNDQK